VLALAGAVIWGCTGQAAAIAVATSEATRAAGSADGAREAATAVDAFGFDLYKTGLAPDGNVVFSPLSVALALSMAQAGAGGETAAQMDAVLHSAAGTGGGNGINSLDRALTDQTTSYTDASGTVQHVSVRIANAPFVQSGLPIQQAFLDTLASRYGADLRLVDFGGDPKGTCRLINDWVSTETEGRISQMLSQVDPSTRLVLANAIYLKAPWVWTFSEGATRPASFTRSDGSDVQVPTMSNEMHNAMYGEGTGWRAVELPYGSGSLAMTVIVPDDLPSFESGLAATSFGRVLAGMEPRTVDLTLPRFKVETRAGLRTALTAMGMPLAFDGGADFSGITTSERLAIADVVHQANIAVDEQGTEATASTIVMAWPVMLVPGERPPVTFHVDRPFIFAVRDKTTGAILFLGRVVDPSA
jgi:serpin B